VAVDGVTDPIVNSILQEIPVNERLGA